MKLSASADEAAAIAAALEQFRAETTPSGAPAAQADPPWTRAALLEGVSAKGTIQDLEGGMR
jgi:hypothetical protein